jgi:hypothetical protein
MDYKTKKEEMIEKYDRPIRALAVANDVDMGIAFDMLEANINNGGTYPYVKVEEFKKDWQELIELAEK